MRILFPYVGDRYGGSNESSLVMAQALQHIGHDPIIVTHGRGRTNEEAARRGLQVIELPPLSRHGGYDRPARARLEDLYALRPGLAAIRRLNPDIVHTNDLTVLRSWALPALLSRTRLVSHWRAASRVSRSISLGFRASDHIVSVSSYSAEFLPGWAKTKTTVEFNALEIFFDGREREAARKVIRDRLELPDNAAIVGIFGNLSKRKRSHVLADVIDQVRNDQSGRPVFGLVCGGPAEPLDHEIYEKIDRFGLQGRIFTPGFVRPVHKWMAACDVILAPAEKEPLARNVLEAMAVGVPTITSADGGLIEVIADGKNGLILDPYQIAPWADATSRILNEPELANRLVANGQSFARSLAPDAHAKRISAIYERIV
jgi:glycosyltransferase involved in cell wall biosynthesis